MDEIREHGVGFAIKNSLLKMNEPGVNNMERISTLHLKTSEGHVNLISVTAPTLCTSQETKDKFYEQLDTVITRNPQPGVAAVAW